MFQRKITENGRVTLPKELLDKLKLKKDDLVDISISDGMITIKKHKSDYVCAITGKVTSQGVKIGENFISYEGLAKIKEYIDRNPELMKKK